MGVLTKIEPKKETMSLNTRIPTKLHEDLKVINKQLSELNSGVEIVLSNVVIKALEQAVREGNKFLTDHEAKLKTANQNTNTSATVQTNNN